MLKESCFSLGKITKLHGYKGAVILHIDSSTPEYFKDLESVLLEIGTELVPFFFAKLDRHLHNQPAHRVQEHMPYKLASMH